MCDSLRHYCRILVPLCRRSFRVAPAAALALGLAVSIATAGPSSPAWPEGDDAIFRAALARPGGLETINQLAWILAVHQDPRVRDPSRAIGLAERLCRRSDDSRPEFLAPLAAAYASAGQFESAVRADRRASAMGGPKDRVEQAKRRRETYEAGRPHREAFHPPFDPPAGSAENQRRAAQAYIWHLVSRHAGRRGEQDESRRALEYSIHCDPSYGPARVELARSLAAAGQHDQAAAHFLTALAATGEHAATLNELGIVWEALGQTQRAIDAYSRALKKRPNWPTAANNLAWILATHADPKLRDGRRAVELAEVAAESGDGLDPLALDTLAAAYAAAGRFDDAVTTIAKAVRLLDDDARHLRETFDQRRRLYAAGQAFHGRRYAHLFFGVKGWEQGRVDAAAEHFLKALEADGRDPAALVELGIARERQGRTHEAIGLYSAALELRPYWPTALNNLAWIAATHQDAKFRDAEVAVRLARRACVENPKADPQLLDTLAAALAEAGEYAEAVDTARRAIELAGSDAKFPSEVLDEVRLRVRLYEIERPFRTVSRAHAQLGSVLLRRGRLAEAAVDLEQAIAAGDDATALNELGILRERQGRPGEAAESYRRALSLRPDWPTAANNLAWLLATHPERRHRDGPQAVCLAQRLCQQILPPPAEFLDTLAAAYAEAARFPDAIATIDKALGRLPPAGDAKLRRSLSQRRERYTSGKPYRQSPAIE